MSLKTNMMCKNKTKTTTLVCNFPGYHGIDGMSKLLFATYMHSMGLEEIKLVADNQCLVNRISER